MHPLLMVIGFIVITGEGRSFFFLKIEVFFFNFFFAIGKVGEV